jgi:hypothetical protein
MAIKTIDLVINTSRGEKNVKKLQQIAKQVEKTFGNLNKLKINIKTDPAQAALKRLNAQIDLGKVAVNSFMDTNRPNQFARKISTIKEEMSFVRKAFDDAVKATDRQRAATTLLAGNFKALRLEATAFAMASGTDPKKTIGDVSARLKEIEKFPRTILAGNEAMSMLKRMQEMTIVGSEEFLRISKAIGRQLGINANIQSQAARAAKPFTAATAFVSQEQISALGGATLVPPSRRLPAAGQTSGTFTIARQLDETSKKRLAREKRITNEAKKQSREESKKAKEAQRRLRNIGRIRKQRRQEQFLGAGFPLLFGGGPGAVGGSILGSALAPKGMGFGAQILGSALGTVLERNLQTVQAIGNAARNINLDALEESGIRVNRELSLTIKLLKQQGKIDEARKKVQQEVFRQTGAVPGASEDLAGSINVLVSQFDRFKALAATALGIISIPLQVALMAILKLVNELLFVFNMIGTSIGFILKELVKLLSFIPGAKTVFKGIEDFVDSTNKGLVNATKTIDDFMATSQAEIDFIKRKMEIGTQAAEREKMINDLVIQGNIDKKKQAEEYLKIVERVDQLLAARREEKYLQKLEGLYQNIGRAVEDGLVNAIQGAIDGTKTLGDVARSVFSEISSALIRFGVNAFLGSLFPNSSFFRANGGTVSRGKSYIVGERGAEMFVPNAGGRIVPNSDMGGSTNVVVNVDASGSSVEGDQQRGKELGAALSVAIQSELLKQKRPGGLLA